jgi:HPt (histidine-containing phosphotransfer) domain-containing protein
MEDETIRVTVDPDLEDLIPGYLEGRGRDAGAMAQALKGKDFETIRILGHSMKGSGGGYGFDAITEIGGGLERAAKAGDGAAIDRLIEELRLYLGRVRVVYG